MKIRVAIELDLMPLLELAMSYVEEADRWMTLKFDADKAAMRAALAMDNPNQQIFIAYEGHQVLGFMWGAVTEMMWSSERIAYDIFLYVHPEHRNLTVAKGLVDAFEKWARVCRAKAIHVGANSGIFKDNAAATLYETLGYDQGGRNFFKQLT